MNRVLTEIKRQENEIYARRGQYCDTVVLGTEQLARLRFQELYFVNAIHPEMVYSKPSTVRGLEIREHPEFDGVLVLPKRKEAGVPMKLTKEEEQLILKSREEKALKKQAKELALRRIRTAHGYAIWLENNGAGDTYSTFCDEFGYEATLGENRCETWHTIHKIWNSVGL